MVDVYIGAWSTVEVPESTNHSAGFVTRLENNKTFHITQKYQRLTNLRHRPQLHRYGCAADIKICISEY